MCHKVVAKVKMSQEIRTCIPLIFGVFIFLCLAMVKWPNDQKLSHGANVVQRETGKDIQ